MKEKNYLNQTLRHHITTRNTQLRKFLAVILIALGLFVPLTASAAKYIYINPKYEASSGLWYMHNWNPDATSWPGTNLTHLSGDVYYAPLKNANNNSCIIWRGEVKAGCDREYHKTSDLSIPNGKNHYKITTAIGQTDWKECYGWYQPFICSGGWHIFVLTPNQVELSASSPHFNGGSGTQHDPYVIDPSKTFTLTASGVTFTPADDNMSPHYAFNDGTTYSATSTLEQTSVSTETTTEYKVSAKGFYSEEYSDGNKTASVYVKTIAQSGPPTVETSAPTSITANSATLNGSVDKNGSDLTAITFKYGLSAGALNLTANAGTTEGPVSADISDLTAGTTYYYVLYAENGSGNTTSSPAASFTTLKLEPTANELDFTIQNFTYDGNAKTIAVSAKAGITADEIGSVTSIYKPRDSEEGGQADGFINAGSYDLWVNVAGGTKYSAKTFKLGEFEINKATLLVTNFGFTPESNDWTGETQGVTITNTLPNDAAGLGEVITKYGVATDAPSEVGTYAISISVGVGDNYEATTTDLSLGTYTINALAPSIEISEVTDKTATTATLNGNVISNGGSEITSLKFNYGKISGSLDKEFTVGVTQSGAFTANLEYLEVATTYYFTATAINGKGTTTTSELDFTTEKLDASKDNFTFSPTTTPYNNTEQGVNISVVGGIEGIGTNYTIKYNDSEIVPTNAGVYTIKISASAGTKYNAYTDLQLDGTYTISKISAPQTLEINSATTISCEDTYTITSTATESDGELTYTKVGGTGIGEITGSTLEITTPGTFILKANKAEGTNYLAQESAEFNLTASGLPVADPTISGENAAEQWEAITLAAATTTTGAEFTWTVSDGATITPAADGTAIFKSGTLGTYTVTAKASFDGCNSDEVTHSIEVSAADPEVCTTTKTIVKVGKPNARIWAWRDYYGNKTDYFSGGWNNRPSMETDDTDSWYEIEPEWVDQYFRLKITWDGDNGSGDITNVNTKGKQYYNSAISKDWTVFAAEDITDLDPDPVFPTVITTTAPAIDLNKVTLSAMLKYTGCTTTGTYGFEYKLASGGEWTQVEAGSTWTAATNYTKQITDLAYNTDYTYRAYANNSEGTAYSAESTFKTGVGCLPGQEFTIADVDKTFNLCDAERTHTVVAEPGGDLTNVTYTFEAITGDVANISATGNVISYTGTEDASYKVTASKSANCFVIFNYDITIADNRPVITVGTEWYSIEPSEALKINDVTVTNQTEQTTIAWTTHSGIVLENANTLSPTYTAPATEASDTLYLSVTNGDCDAAKVKIPVQVNRPRTLTVYYYSVSDSWKNLYGHQKGAKEEHFLTFWGHFAEDGIGRQGDIETYSGVGWRKLENDEPFQHNYSSALVLNVYDNKDNNTGDVSAIDSLFQNGEWVSDNMTVWIYANEVGGSSKGAIITNRAYLQSQIENDDYIAAYDNGTNPGYTDASYEDYKNAYELAITTCGAYASTQADIDAKLSELTTAYAGLTEPGKPTLTLQAATDITINSGKVHATITDEGGVEITEYGFVYSATDDLTNITDLNVLPATATKVAANDINENKQFSYTIEGLNDGTTYYFVAYAVNSVDFGISDAPIGFFETLEACQSPFAIEDKVQTLTPCSSDMFVAQLTTSTGSIPADAQFTWTGTDVANTLSATNVERPEFVGTASGTYNYVVTVKSQANPLCFAAANYTITYNSIQPVIEMIPDSINVNPLSTTLIDWVDALDANTYNWSIMEGEGTLANETTLEPTFTAPSLDGTTPKFTKVVFTASHSDNPSCVATKELIIRTATPPDLTIHYGSAVGDRPDIYAWQTKNNVNHELMGTWKTSTKGSDYTFNGVTWQKQKTIVPVKDDYRSGAFMKLKGGSGSTSYDAAFTNQVLSDGEWISQDLHVWAYCIADNNIRFTVRTQLDDLLWNADVRAAYNASDNEHLDGTNPDNKYTTASYDAFNAAYEASHGTCGGYESTQTEIDNAYNALNAAYQALELATIPTVETNAASGVSFDPDNKATLNANITDNGGFATTKYGFRYSQDANADLTTEGTLVELSGEKTGAYSSEITNLSSGTYYFMAYATTVKGTGYGVRKQFSISKTPAIFYTKNPEQIRSNSAKLVAEITRLGNDGATERGFVISENPITDPVTGTPVPADNLSQIGIYSVVKDGLTANTTYYYVAYIKDGLDVTIYSKDAEGALIVKQFTTLETCESEFTLNDFDQLISACGGTRTINMVTGTNMPANATYSWSPSYGLSSTTVAQPEFNGDAKTDYVLTVTNADSPQCFATANVTIDVNNNRPQVTINTGDNQIKNQSMTWQLSSTITGTSEDATIIWNDGGAGGTFKDGKNNIANPVYITPATAGNYKLTLTVNEGNCSEVKTINFSVEIAYNVKVYFTDENQQRDYIDVWQSASGDKVFDHVLYANTTPFLGNTTDWHITEFREFDHTKTGYFGVKVSPSDGHGGLEDVISKVYVNSAWISSNIEIWAYSGENWADTRVTFRADLRDLILNSDVVAAYNEGVNNGYTDASYNVFRIAYLDARAVCSGRNSEQTEIDAALTALQNAYNGLILNIPPVVETNEAGNILGKSAVLKGNITSLGGGVVEYGFKYIEGIDFDPETQGTNVTSEAAARLGTYSIEVEGLNSNTTYSYVAFASNGSQTVYGEKEVFTTLDHLELIIKDCGPDGSGISIDETGKVSFVIENIGTQDLELGTDFRVVLTDFDNPRELTPTTGIIEDGKTMDFETVFGSNVNPSDCYLIVSISGALIPTRTCTTERCTKPTEPKAADNDTLYYLVDANLPEAKDCRLQFPSVEAALNDLKADRNFFSVNNKLEHNVVIEVLANKNPYIASTDVGVTGGTETTAKAHIIDNINNFTGAKTADNLKQLVIRSKGTPYAQVVHPAIRNSRNVKLENLNLTGDPTGLIKDNAVDIDVNNGSWTSLKVGQFKNAKIHLKGCNISSLGFTCIHASAVDGLKIEECDITANYDMEGATGNTKYWGASVKFLAVSNIAMIRNALRGDHATSVWVQAVDGLLLMNNVFWLNNQLNFDNAVVRLGVQSSYVKDVKNIGIYYNTMYLAANENEIDYKVDFFRLGGLGIKNDKGEQLMVGDQTSYKTATIEFKYNNCYSYDDHTSGRTQDSDAFLGLSPWSGLDFNNFWSVYDAAGSTTSAFAFCGGDNPFFINVKEMVCKTGASDPSSLVIKGQDLNEGPKPGTDASGQEIANNTEADFNYDNARESAARANGWTLGAFQYREAIDVNTIIWQGGAEVGYETSGGGSSDGGETVVPKTTQNDWDNRNNYVKTDGTKLTCVDNLAEDLVVIIPAPNSDVYKVPSGGIKFYPQVPDFFDEGRPLKEEAEQVDAGVGVQDCTPSKFADHIKLEYGASLRGVENLRDGNVDRYNTAEMNFIAQRKEWILVGTVIKPFINGNDGPVRDVLSGDFYLNHLPNVFMREALLDAGGNFSWDASFPNLDAGVPADKVYAISIPDTYGYWGAPANIYYAYEDPKPGKLDDGDIAKEYTFKGRFVNEDDLPLYEGLEAGKPVLLNNTYPSNLDPFKMQTEGLGTVQLYHYKGTGQATASFGALKDGDLIKPQQGFIITPTSSSVSITSDMLADGSTEYRSARSTDDIKPYISLSTNYGYSELGSYVNISYDEFKGLPAENIYTDAPKVYAVNNKKVPELYVMMYNKEYAAIDVESTDKVIPLGLSLSSQMNVRFSIMDSEGYSSAILEDRETGETYELIHGRNVVVENLPAGIIEGRFFLNTGVSEEDVEEDDDVVTDVETEAESNITVCSTGSIITISSTSDIELQKAYISDMTGKTAEYELKGNFDKINLGVSTGVYIVSVIGDNASYSTKVVIKD